MESLLSYVAPPSQCGYLPDQTWRLEYELVGGLTREDYLRRMLHGWRRFGDTLFRPRCRACHACRSLRVVVDRFRPDRGQRRVHRANQGMVHVRVAAPSVSAAKLDLYDRYHAYQSLTKGWPFHSVKDTHSYRQSFVDNPFPTQEWCYYLDDRLVGVGYVDDLPGALSAIYFFYDPDLRQRSLGTWNVLNLLEHAAARRVPHLYLGYYVADCPSMAYKARFVPNQLLDSHGAWHDFSS
ncbi:MAG TPA: arginyltransferase [Gemmataceae bacterium]|jgi:arginine-tRNA-protein transferase|nr:arginyltransferase [Gemmataceae bacterium]